MAVTETAPTVERKENLMSESYDPNDNDWFWELYYRDLADPTESVEDEDA